jgi:hypothetical protein
MLRTLADFPAIVAQLLVQPDEDDPTLPTAMIKAPCCGRHTTAESVIDVRNVPNTVVRAGGIYEPNDHDWLCDGCQFRLIADETNDWTSSKLLEACGAPAQTVNEHVVREWETTAQLETFARQEAFEPEVIRGQLEEQVTRLHLKRVRAEAEVLRART